MVEIVAVLPVTQITQIAPISRQLQNVGEKSLLSEPLLNSSQIDATVIGKDDKGNFLLRTDKGNLSLKSDLPLTYNSDIVIKFDNAQNGKSNAHIISVNGEPIESFSAPNNQENDSVSNLLLTKTAQIEKPSLEENLKTINATIVESPKTAENILSKGTQVIAYLQTVQPQAKKSGNIPPDTETSQNTEDTIETADTPSKSANIGKPTPQPTDSEITPKTTTPTIVIYDDGENNKTTASPLYSAYDKQLNQVPTLPDKQNPPTLLDSKVAQIDDQGIVTLQTGLGVIKIKVDSEILPKNLSVGSNIKIDLAAIPQNAIQQNTLVAQIVAGHIAENIGFIPQIAASWQSLKDIFKLQSGDTTTSEENIDSTHISNPLADKIPKLGDKKFISASLAFLNSLIHSNAESFLGEDTVENIKRSGHNELLQKFTREFDAVGQNFLAPQQQNSQNPWQALFMPFMFQDNLQQANIYVRKDSQNKSGEQDNSAGGTRFIIEVELNKFGAVQMDGLVKKAQNSQFNLIIRSNKIFSNEDQSAIGNIFNDVALQTGFSGILTFQHTKDFSVKPLKEIVDSAIDTPA